MFIVAIKSLLIPLLCHLIKHSGSHIKDYVENEFSLYKTTTKMFF